MGTILLFLAAQNNSTLVSSIIINMPERHANINNELYLKSLKVCFWPI